MPLSPAHRGRSDDLADLGLSFRAVFDAAPDVLIISDADGHIVAASRRLQDFLGYTPEEVSGWLVERLLPVADRERHRVMCRRFLENPSTRPMGGAAALQALRKDGSIAEAEISLSPLPTARGPCVLTVLRDVSDRPELVASASRLAALVQSSDDAIVATTTEGVITDWNPAAVRLFGFTAGEAVHQPIGIIAADDAATREQETIREEILRTRVPRRYEALRQRRGGVLIDVAVAVSATFDERGRVVGLTSVYRDVTEHNAMVRELRLRAGLLDAVDAAVIAADTDGLVAYWNRGAETLYGWRADEVLGKPIAGITVGPDDAGLAAEILAEIHEHGRWEGIFPVRSKDGRTFPALVRDVVYHDADGAPAGVIGVSVDMSERLAIEDDLRSARDFLDAVTQHVGEGLMTIDAEGRIGYTNRRASELFGFSGGELAGSSVLDLLGMSDEAVARLQPASGVARLDGETALCRDGSLLPVDITSSALHHGGRHEWVLVIADDTERRAAIERLERELEEVGWVGRVQDALRHDLLRIVAQPILDLSDDTIRHHELLLRLMTPDGGEIGPASFLSAAERHGLIGDVDKWVIRRAIELAAAGHSVAVNLSAHTLGDRSAHSWITERIRRAAIDPEHLIFEITETALLHDQTAGAALARALTRLGCKVALDDFGSGYGGFVYLKQLDVALLKIDSEFVRGITDDEASRHVVAATVGLARAFGLRTIAEGVESAEDLATLRELGVDLAQGYFIGRPAPLPITGQTDA
jgi:PAS domain S-box-containing protein